MVLVRDLKRGNIYTKNGYTIYFSGGKFHYSCFEFNNRYKTLQSLKDDIREKFNINIR